MKLTTKQIETLEEAQQLIDNVHYEVEQESGDESAEFIAVNEVWCLLDNLIKSAK
jgi:hypothetical protein